MLHVTLWVKGTTVYNHQRIPLSTTIFAHFSKQMMKSDNAFRAVFLLAQDDDDGQKQNILKIAMESGAKYLFKIAEHEKVVLTYDSYN